METRIWGATSYFQMQRALGVFQMAKSDCLWIAIKSQFPVRCTSPYKHLGCPTSPSPTQISSNGWLAWILHPKWQSNPGNTPQPAEDAWWSKGEEEGKGMGSTLTSCMDLISIITMLWLSLYASNPFSLHYVNPSFSLLGGPKRIPIPIPSPLFLVPLSHSLSMRLPWFSLHFPPSHSVQHFINMMINEARTCIQTMVFIIQYITFASAWKQGVVQYFSHGLRK